MIVDIASCRVRNATPGIALPTSVFGLARLILPIRYINGIAVLYTRNRAIKRHWILIVLKNNPYQTAQLN